MVPKIEVVRPVEEGPMAFPAGPVRPDVIVVGSINVDFVVRVPRLPRAGETVTGGTFERHGGGKGANQAVAGARSGAAVRFVGAVGDDELGRWQLQELAEEGIDVGGLAQLPRVATGVALITVDDATGENQIAVASGANAQLGSAAAERGLESVEPATGAVCLLGFEVPDAVLVVAADWAGRHGLRVIVNPAPARPIRPEVLALRPILTPNEAEAMALTGEVDAERAGEALRRLTGAPVLVTLGPDGAVFADEAGRERIPAFPVSAVDTTGAGDVLNGALAAALARGEELQAAVRWAMAAAALSTTRVGARSAPPPSEVDVLLAS